MTNEQGAPRLHSIEATGSLLGIGRTQVFSLIRSGQLHSVKIGARRLVATSAIDDYVAALCEDAATE